MVAVAVATGRSGDGDEPRSLIPPGTNLDRKRAKVWRSRDHRGRHLTASDALSLAPRTPQTVTAAVSRRQLQTMQSRRKSLLENGLICR